MVATLFAGAFLALQAYADPASPTPAAGASTGGEGAIPDAVPAPQKTDKNGDASPDASGQAQAKASKRARNEIVAQAQIQQIVASNPQIQQLYQRAKTTQYSPLAQLPTLRTLSGVLGKTIPEDSARDSFNSQVRVLRSQDEALVLQAKQFQNDFFLPPKPGPGTGGGEAGANPGAQLGKGPPKADTTPERPNAGDVAPPGGKFDPMAGGVESPGGGANPVTNPAYFAELFSPDNPATQQRVGQWHLQRGDPGSAYRAFDRAISQGAATGQNYFMRGFSAHKLMDFERAHRDAEIALQFNPENRDARDLFHLTIDKASRVRLGASAPAWQSAEPDGEDAPAGAKRELQALSSAAPRDPAAVLQEIQRRSGGDPTQAAANLVREARTYLNLKDAENAVAMTSRAVELDPRNAAAYHVRAVAENQLGRFVLAAQDASSSLALVAPEQGLPALKTRAWALNSLRRFPEALQDALHAKQIKPGDGFVLMSEARALGGLGRREEMVSRLREAAAIEPEKYRPLFDAAVQLPSDADTETLFTGVSPGVSAPAPAASGRGWQRLRLLLYCLAGGFLIALGLSHFGVSEKAATTARRILAGPGEKQEPPAMEAAVSTAGGDPRFGGGDPRFGGGDPRLGGGFWSRYDGVRELAKGGMGIVYEAVDRGLDRLVAVKKMREELRTDPRERERFLKEARTVAGLQHPNIVQIFQVAEDGIDAYLVFEHVDGETLHDRLKRAKRLELPETVDILRGVAAAIDHAHAHGLTHRDLKPSNIMINKEGVVKVMDFGIARQAKDALTKLSMTNTVCGTPPYMAPEQEQGLVCKESDIFSLGVVAYELLSGTLPFEGAPGAMLLAKMSARFEPLSARVKGPGGLTPLPAGIDEAIGRALSPDHAARFRRASEFVAALEALVPAKA